MNFFEVWKNGSFPAFLPPGIRPRKFMFMLSGFKKALLQNPPRNDSGGAISAK